MFAIMHCSRLPFDAIPSYERKISWITRWKFLGGFYLFLSRTKHRHYAKSNAKFILGVYLLHTINIETFAVAIWNVRSNYDTFTRLTMNLPPDNCFEIGLHTTTRTARITPFELTQHSLGRSDQHIEWQVIRIKEGNWNRNETMVSSYGPLLNVQQLFYTFERFRFCTFSNNNKMGLGYKIWCWAIHDWGVGEFCPEFKCQTQN